MNRFSPIVQLLPAFLLFLSTQLSAQLAPDYSLLTKKGTLQFPENIGQYDAKATLHENEVVEGHFYRLIQFYHIPDARQKADIEAAGIQLLDYVPHNTYIAALPTALSGTSLEALNVRGILPIPYGWKMDDRLFMEPLPAYAVARNQIELIVKYYGDLDAETVLRYCENDKIKVVRQNGQNNFLRVRVPKNRVEAIAQLPYIAYVDLVPDPGQPEDDLGRSLHRANAIDTYFDAGRKYTGAGVGVLVRDDGFVGPHVDFHGRITQDVNSDGGIQHSDGVAGIFAGSGNKDPKNRGMAAGSDVYVLDYQADFLDNTLDLHLFNEVLVTNSSYSNGCNTGYTTITITVDQQMYENPTFLHVFSAGNSNNQNCGYGAGNQWGNITGGHKQGKNVIATANLFADGVLVNSSSRGPAHDGRIKPDIAANGQNQISTDPNHEYAPFGGTSGASPGIAGITAQLHQAYRDLNDGETAEGGFLKAVLMNSANEMGNDGPDFKFGWGHVNAYRAALTLEEGRYLSDEIEQGEANTHTITIPDGVNRAKIMVYWTDKEGSEFTSKALVNDLNTSIADPFGTMYQPWVLDPTPDPALLDMPAVTGTDTLNNVEQIAIDNPEAGDYTLTVDGAAVPFGPQKYFVVYEFLTDDITVIYPIGGEGFAPTETERIHWDAWGEDGEFTIEYSVNGGSTWNAIATVPGSARMHDWLVPSFITGDVLVRVTRDAESDMSDAPFSIASVPGGLEVTQACPDFIRVEWDAVTNATGYDVFSLGAKYMDSIGTTTETFFDIPISNPTTEHWFSVRTLGPDNARSRRAIAIQYQDGLLNCPLDISATASNLINPNIQLITGCDAYESNVQLEVINEGLTDLTDLTFAYQLNNDPVVSEPYGSTLPVGESVTYTFTTPLVIDTDGDFELSVWVEAPGEEATFNDTLTTSLTSALYPGTGEPYPFLEDFEAATPPPFWIIDNPDGSFTWEPNQVVGIDGNTTNTLYVNNYSYNGNGAEDYLISIPIDLSDATTGTFLTFDVAYAPYNLTQYFDGLRVDVYGECGETFLGSPYYKEADDLGTVPPQTSPWEPASGNDWRTETIDLTDYLGSSVVFHFVNVSGYGNSLFIDNINVETILPPDAGLSSNATQVCKGDAVVFSDVSQGENLTYDWSFGTGAVPSTQDGPGPHIINFTEAGTNTVTLIVTNGAGSDTATLDIQVDPLPVAEYTFNQDQNQFSFTDASSFGDTYSWDFGDGNTSTDPNPSHFYTEAGDYTVTLVVENDCGTDTYVQTVTVSEISSVRELPAGVDIALFPNPNSGKFAVTISTWPDESMEFQVTDVTGRQVFFQKLQTATNSRLQHEIDLRQLEAGVYFLQVRGDSGTQTIQFIVQ